MSNTARIITTKDIRQARKALRQSADRIDQLCGMVNHLANKLGLGNKVNAPDWSDAARGALAVFDGGEDERTTAARSVLARLDSGEDLCGDGDLLSALTKALRSVAE